VQSFEEIQEDEEETTSSNKEVINTQQRDVNNKEIRGRLSKRKFNFVNVKTGALSDITDECFNTERAVSAQN